MKDFSFKILDTGDGQRAWEIIKSQRIDLIISGNTMLGMSGFELAQKVKGTNSPYKDIPFIFSSGTPGSYDEKINDIGAINLPKPYTLKEFQNLIRELLS